MPLSHLEHDNQLMIVGFFFMRKHKHAPTIHTGQLLGIFIELIYLKYNSETSQKSSRIEEKI